MPNRLRFQWIVYSYMALTQTPALVWLLMHGWLFPSLAAFLSGAALGWPLRPAVQGRGWRLMPLALIPVGAAWLIHDSLVWAVLDLTVTTLILVAGWPDGPRRRKRAVLLGSPRHRRWSVGIPIFRAIPVFTEIVPRRSAATPAR